MISATSIIASPSMRLTANLRLHVPLISRVDSLPEVFLFAILRAVFLLSMMSSDCYDDNVATLSEQPLGSMLHWWCSYVSNAKNWWRYDVIYIINVCI